MNSPNLILIRGLQGSGKSTIAKSLLATRMVDKVVEIDDFWAINGRYKYFEEVEPEARTWVFAQVKYYIHQGLSVCVPDVFERIELINPYEELMKYRGGFYVYLCNSLYSKDPKWLAEHNLHGVNQVKIEKILREWEPYPKELEFYRETNIKDLFTIEKLGVLNHREYPMDLDGLGAAPKKEYD